MRLILVLILHLTTTTTTYTMIHTFLGRRGDRLPHTGTTPRTQPCGHFNRTATTPLFFVVVLFLRPCVRHQFDDGRTTTVLSTPTTSTARVSFDHFHPDNPLVCHRYRQGDGSLNRWEGLLRFTSSMLSCCGSGCGGRGYGSSIVRMVPTMRMIRRMTRRRPRRRRVPGGRGWWCRRGY